MHNSPKLPAAVYVDKVTGMDSSGEPRWFKVCIHPDYFDENATHLMDVTAALNSQKSKNYFRYSGYVDCPLPNAGGEPFAKAYRVESWEGLEALLTQLSTDPRSNVGEPI